MASNEEVPQALNDAIETLAKRAGVEAGGVAEYAGGYAYAANQLAEARAWMQSYSQPHGGSIPPSRD